MITPFGRVCTNPAPSPPAFRFPAPAPCARPGATRSACAAAGGCKGRNGVHHGASGIAPALAYPVPSMLTRAAGHHAGPEPALLARPDHICRRLAPWAHLQGPPGGPPYRQVLLRTERILRPRPGRFATVSTCTCGANVGVSVAAGRTNGSARDTSWHSRG
jgi:hypothetical protein